MRRFLYTHADWDEDEKIPPLRLHDIFSFLQAPEK